METTRMIRIFARAFALAILAAPFAQAETPPAGGVSVEHPWARATAASATTGAAYLTFLALRASSLSRLLFVPGLKPIVG
jgi:copper(I)-binding protein